MFHIYKTSLHSDILLYRSSTSRKTSSWYASIFLLLIDYSLPLFFLSHVSEKLNLLCPGKNGKHCFRETCFGIVIMLVQFRCPHIGKFGFWTVPCEHITRHKGHPPGFQCVLNHVCCIKLCNADLCYEVHCVSRHCICSRSKKI